MFTWMDSMYFKARGKFQQFIRTEDGDVNIVSMVVLMGVAIILAIAFRKQISGVITNLINSIEENAGNAIKVTE